MIAFPPVTSLPAERLAELHAIGRRLKTESPAQSPADTVACAYGVGSQVLAWYDESQGRYFDLASLTKPLFTAPVVLRLFPSPEALEQPVADLLPWLPWLPARPTLRGLLTHAEGLPGELPPDGDAAEVNAWVVTRLQELAGPADLVTYSDVNYWLLGAVATAVAGTPLHTLLAEAPTVAACGIAFGRAPAVRSVPAGPVAGDVRLPHDPAARRLGPSGHAGAFGTLAGVVDAVLSWIDHDWLPDSLVTAAFTCQTHRIPGGHRSLAWTLAGDQFHAVAHDWPPSTLCHTGFTGVSVALDPVSRWWAVYLSNAVPVDRDARPILVARRLFHAAAASHLQARSSEPSTA